MTAMLAICVAVIFAVSIYLMLGRELKEVAMGVFLLTHAAHLGILAMSGSPVDNGAVKSPPVLGASTQYVDPLPQALILTSIVISFAVMAFILTLLVATHRRTHDLDVNRLGQQDRPKISTEF
ncbi:MAG: NADH-quinone oxidoreductase subunit K [Planctomycetota bacterium]|nr:NADH-quinone oxidoreductase subunit K [Planctomycetota bacterium]